jgi:two-component system, cell cycle sensor histidine kinase and response regulator CckA
MRILSVDDKDENRYLAEALFRGNGYEVHSVANGAEALAQLKVETFDLIISDILMPVMDGFQLCRIVKADERLRRIPFIIYTATYTGPQDEAFAMKIGADRFIQKPCEPDIFIETVREVLSIGKDKDTDKIPSSAAQEEEVLKLYNERLVRKLEQKMLQLEEEVQARKKAEEILEQNEKRYRTLYNSIRDAILVTDTNRKIIDCNQAFMDLFGFSLSEIAGQEACILYENEDDFRQLGIALQDHSDDSNILYTVGYKKKDGSVFPGEVNVFYLKNDDGAIAGYIGLIRDITERVQAEITQRDLESQLHQAQKMESVGRLAGGVAHDFNNLLSIILGYGEMAMRTLDETHSLYESLTQIHQAGLRAKELTRQLLAFSSKQVMEMKIEDVNNIVTGFEKLLRRLIGEDIRLNLALTSKPLPVKVDTSQMEQVLMNLAVNARDAMPDGGILTIETEVVELDAAYSAKKTDVLAGRYAMMSVNDTGCGMNKATIDRIFEPFFTTKGKDKGTGLGLATLYGIVKQHGGNVYVYSEPGEGTVFKIYLPLTDENTQLEASPEKSDSSTFSSATVLVVEDEPTVRKLACQILVDQGYSVIDSNEVEDAIAKAKSYSGPIHLVLADVVMPMMKGPEVFDKICEYHPEAKILYMSGYTDNMIACRGVLKEGIQFIQKPFTVKGLLQKCAYVLHNT